MPITTVRAVQWNVLEDGLTEAPSAISFSPSFDGAFDTLLAELSVSGAGERFIGFASTRDFTAMPGTVPIDSTARFKGFAEVLYNSCYHATGGEAELDKSPLGNSLRSLFLASSLQDASAAPGSPENLWESHAFESELLKATASLDEPEPSRAAVREVRAQVFDPRSGTLSWPGAVARRIAKRSTKLYNTWMGLDREGRQLVRGLRVFLDPPEGATDDPAVAAALARFCRVERAAATCDGERGGAAPTRAPTRALVEVRLGAEGELEELRTPTLHAALRWLLRELCVHAKGNPRAPTAVETFVRAVLPAGGTDEAGANEATVGASGAAAGAAAAAAPSSDPDESDPEEWAAAVYARLQAAALEWSRSSALPHRHARVCVVLAEAAPHLVFAEEYDDRWRAEALPPGRRYAAADGKGTARVLYDSDVFEEVALGVAPFAALDVPRSVRR